MNNKKRVKIVAFILLVLVVSFCLFYLWNELGDQPNVPVIRHDNVNLNDFLILEGLLGDGYVQFLENARHRNLGFAMQFANKSYYYERPGLGFREGVVHYKDSYQAYKAFQGYLYQHDELDTKKPSLIHPEYKKDKTIHWYAGIIPPDEN
jgi:hypothetical protein